MNTAKRSWQFLSRVFFALAIYLTHQSVFALPAYEIVRPLFSNGSISIYPESRHPRSQVRDWCGSRKYSDAPAKLEVVYDLSHKSRDSLFPQGYEAFVDTSVRAVLGQHCSDFNPANVELYFYRRNEDYHLDKMRFQLRNEKGANVVALISKYLNNKHPANKRAIAQNELGSCTGKPFCDFSGGIYLNAIYENNESLILKLNQEIMAEMKSGSDVKGYQDFIAAISGNFSEDNSHINVGLNHVSLLKFMATKYMALYGDSPGRNNGSACLQADSVSITRKYTTDVIRFENQLGIDQGAVGGDTYSEVYTINKEFEPLCNTICGALGEGGSLMLGLIKESYKSKLVFDGVGQVLHQADCNSAEVKQFERNLISLTERAIKRSPISTRVKREHTDAEKAQDVKRNFMEAMNEYEAQSKTPQTSTRRPRERTSTQQPQTNTSRQNERSRMARLSTQPAMSELEINLKAGEQFLATNKQKGGVVETGSGLQYKMIKNGSGRTPQSGDQVTAHMRLTLIDGRVIHDTFAEGKPATFALGQIIPGFNEGLKLLSPGGKIQLYIPSSLAYGNRAAGGIPAGSTFIYDVELMSIK